MMTFNNRRLIRPVGGVAAAAALVGALALTPAGALAQKFVLIFEPQSFTAVPVTRADIMSLRSLPNLESYGTMTQSGRSTAQTVADAPAASAASNLAVLAPASLPSGVPATASYTVLSPSTAAFTFSAAKAGAAASATGKALPSMPAGVDGSTLQVTLGPVVVTSYGGSLTGFGSTQGAGQATHGKPILRPAAVLRGRLTGGGTDRQGAMRVNGQGASGSAGLGGLPSLAIVEAPMPHVTSTGATVKSIEDYLLAQPGVSPTLASEIRAIGDPTTTLPIPILVDKQNAQTVQVQGVSGLAIGDNTGVGSGVIWQKGGVVYGVAGTLPEDQIVAIANSLH